MIRRTKIAIALSAAGALLLSGCTGAGSGSTDDAATLKLGTIVAPTSFDPADSDSGNVWPFYQAVYDTLLVATPDGTVEPWLATDWSYNDDNTVLTMHLRDDVVFTDGSELTASVVEENLERYIGGTASGSSNLASVTEVDAPDTSTVVLTLSEPNPALLNYLSRAAGLVASGDAVENDDLVTTPVGSGPYILDTASTVGGSTYVYTKNPDYWNPDVQYYDALTITVLSDATAATNAIKAGELNASRLTTNDIAAEVESAGWGLSTVELDVAGLYLFDRDGTMNEALADVRVRQAINYAFDREGLLTALQDGRGTVTTQVFPASSDAFDTALDETYPYDPEKAKELLAEAGYADGLTIAMPTSTSLFGERTYTLIAQQLADVGITVQATDLTNNFVPDMIAPKYPASYATLQANTDWELINFMIAPSATFNPFHSDDPTVAALISEIQYGDEDTQASAATELNAYLVEQAWFAPFYRIQGSFATDANTTVEMDPGNIFPSLYDIKPAA